MIIAWDFKTINHYLIAHCYDSNVSVMPLADNELELNDGRFKNFAKYVWWNDNVVHLKLSSNHTVLWNGTEVSKVIEWIDIHVMKWWTLQLLLDGWELSNYCEKKYCYWIHAFEFSFESEVDRMYFALRWF